MQPITSSSDSQIPVRSAAPAPFWLRGLRGIGYGIVVGLCVGALRAQSVAATVIYSGGIALLCWLSIDLGRRYVARWLGSPAPSGAEIWPSWPWVALIVLVGSSIAFVGGTALGDFLTGFHSPGLFLTRYPRQSIVDLLVVLIPAVSITFFFYSRSVLTERKILAQTAQRQAAESRLRLLEAQLEPHMFFNTLANLRVLIAMDPPRAQHMLDQLIAFLRATLSASRVSEHPLHEEFTRTRDYLSLMKVRMQDRLQDRFDLPPDLEQVLVPPLLLQPLVENAIRHGLEPAVRGGRIEVRASRAAEFLLIHIRDTGVGMGGSHPDSRQAHGRWGFGLAQVRERLATRYGSRANLALLAAPDEEGGTVAVVRLPLL